MHHKMLIDIDGAWVDARNALTWNAINPTTEEALCVPPLGTHKMRTPPLTRHSEPNERGTMLHRPSRLIRDQLDLLAPIMTRDMRTGVHADESLSSELWVSTSWFRRQQTVRLAA